MAEYKGVPVCLAGVARVDGGLFAFSELRDHDAPKMTVYRTARALFEKIKKTGPVIIADPEQLRLDIAKNAPRFLESLGFYRIDGGLYRWDNLPD